MKRIENMEKMEKVDKSEKIIEFKNVSKVYNTGEKEFKALNSVNLSINKGEFVVILGPSGAGKSTLLNLLRSEWINHHVGKIIVDKKNISEYTDLRLADYRAENIGFIFQFYNILPTLTVLENVAIVNDIVKKPKDAKKILKEVGLEKHLNKFPNQLSGGEQQRVSIARAIAKDPLLLLCDEPTGALDSKTGVEVLKLLKKQCHENNGKNTVVIVTHNVLISEIADRVIKLKNGKVEENIINNKPKSIDEVVW